MSKEDKKELTEITEKTISDLYDSIKFLDKKINNNEKTIKFITSQQSEQMKELIYSKTENLRKFFEEAIRLQTEIISNSYENIITDLKSSFERELKNKDLENIRFCNQKDEITKANYESQITAIKADYERQIEELKRVYENRIRETADKVYKDTKAEDESLLKQTSDEVYNNVKSEYELKIEDIKKYYEKEMEKSYFNGKSDAEAWQEKIVQDKLNEQAAFYNKEIERVKQETENSWQIEMERVKKETKDSLYEEMDKAARRNEEELKLFLDFYEAKMKPFKKLINIHETTDQRIKDIQNRLKKEFDKTFKNDEPDEK